jgi:hypothetical protein
MLSFEEANRIAQTLSEEIHKLSDEQLVYLYERERIS